MQVVASLGQLAGSPDADQAAVITIGNFDGVHLGHQAMLQQVRQRAHLLRARSVAVTFDPHPSRVFGKPEGASLQLLTPLPVKLELLARTGIDLAVVLPFGQELHTLPARAFVQHVLCAHLHAVEVHEGESFRFGRHAEGNMATMEALGVELGFRAVAHGVLRRRGAPVSSSRIRSLVSRGALDTARALLGRPFFLDSTPARGRGYGTRYAVPTVNLQTPEELLPAHGVYATVLEVGQGSSKDTFAGVTNAGNRPTFGADSYAIETHLFDFRPIDLHLDTPLRLHFLHRLREERRFPDPEALKQQIGRDVLQAQRLFRLLQRLGAACQDPTVSAASIA